MAKVDNQYNIKMPWKDEVEDVRYLSKSFGNENVEWSVAFEAGYDPLRCHNALKDFHGLFDWCEDEYWKKVYIARSWNSACYVTETRTGTEDLGDAYKLNAKAYKPITNKWLELMPSAKRKLKPRKPRVEDSTANSASIGDRVVQIDTSLPDLESLGTSGLL